MLSWALMAFVIALIAALLGFGGLTPSGFATVAKGAALGFLLLAVLALVVGLNRGRPST